MKPIAPINRLDWFDRAEREAEASRAWASMSAHWTPKQLEAYAAGVKHGYARAVVDLIEASHVAEGAPSEATRPTLDQWAERHRVKVNTHQGAGGTLKIVPADVGADSHRELFWLADFVVSSVSAGSVWLMARKAAH
jgi:hypothetical protein